MPGRRFRVASAAVAVLSVLGWSVQARAASCDALTKLGPGGSATADAAPPVIYVTGSSAIKPIIAALAPVMFADTSRPTTIVYRGQGSCAGVSAVVSGAPMATDASTTASYWDPNSLTLASANKTTHEETCTLPNGTLADVGVSDVFAQTCNLAAQGLPPGTADFQGPIQAMTFAVNKASKEQSISAEAAYLTFGLAKLAPWLDQNFIYRRNALSGTQQMIAAAIRVDPNLWKGAARGSNDEVFASLAGLIKQDEIDKAVGILAADYSARAEVRQLAYQHYGQRCGYKPDVVMLDKRNVREGRYAIWGPLHLFTQIDATGLAKNVRARDLIAYLLGTQPAPLGVNLIRTEAQLHVVPPCAMKVQRSSEMGPISSSKPPRPCGCAFDQEATGTTKCKACSASQPCSGTDICNFGFCEAP